MNAQQHSLPPTTSAWPTKRTWCVWLLLVTITLGLFVNGWSAPFTFDDISNVQANPEIRQLWPIEPLLNESRMVGYYSFALNYACGAREPGMYRLTNIFLHAMAGCVLYLLVRSSLQRAAWSRSISIELLATTIALLWLIHPFQTGSVTYVVQRLESLMGLFYLLALVCLVRGANSSRAAGWYIGTIVACWLGLFTKEVMATFVPVALLYDRIFLANSWQEVLRRRGWVYGGCCVGITALMYVTTLTYGADANTTAGFHSTKLTAWMYLRTQPEVILHYLRLSVWPVGQSIDYGWPVQHNPLIFCGFGSVIVGMLGTALYGCWQNAKWGWMGLTFFLILAPTSSFLPIDDIAFEHRMYLPLACVLAGVILSLAFFVERWCSERWVQTVFVGIVCTMASFWSYCTFTRNQAYVNNLGLWQSAVNLNPHHARAWNNLAGAYRKLQDYEASRECFEKALQLKPDDKYALTQLPLVLTTLSQRDKNNAYGDEAVELAQHLVQLFSDQPRHRLSLIKLLDKLDRNAEAEQECRRLLAELQSSNTLAEKARKRPRWDLPMLDGNAIAETHFLWALLLIKRKAWEESWHHLEQAQALADSDATVYFQQGVVLGEMQQIEAALEKYQQAIALEVSHEAAWNNRAMLLAKQGRVTEAAQSYRQALYWKPAYPEALDNYGNLFARAKQYAAAVALYERALKVDAGYKPAQEHLVIAKQRLASPE
jgi:protein O-mannosyl-transferase